MSDSSRFNSPSRKSRFRAQGRGRPAGYSPEQGGEESPAEDLAAADVSAADNDAYDELPVEEVPAEAAADAGSGAQDALPAGLRLTRDPDAVTIRQGLSIGAVVFLALSALVAGGVLGYVFGHAQGKKSVPQVVRVDDSTKKQPLLSLPNNLQAEIEGAFDDIKQARYSDARKKFEELYKQHPEWPSMEIEAARASLYERDTQSTQNLLNVATRERPLADAALLTALLRLTSKEYDAADASFATAAATDPARADVYFFWGENLRREGKPQEAAEKFKSAIVRNQYENVEPLYQMKYWISLVQADQEGPTGEGAKIDAILASPRPSSAALLAGAARALKNSKYAEAGDLLSKAQAVTDPTVFGVVLRDPFFMESNLRPELAKFYR